MGARMSTRVNTSTSLGVVITGSTRGVGRALAEEFVKAADGVVVASRTADAVDKVVSNLRGQYPAARVYGVVADVAKAGDVERLVDFASENLGTVNAFICNAGVVGRRAAVKDLMADELKAVVETNLLGPMYCAKEAVRIAEKQSSPLHVFIMDGSGTRGNATDMYAAYGATKRSVPQLVSSLSKEEKDGKVRFHTLSPGMVLTGLLLNTNVSPPVRKIFNILAEEPETVSADLVPRIRAVVVGDKSQTYTAFLTIPKALFQLVTGFLLGFRKNKFFDQITGERVDQTAIYTDKGVRIQD